MEHTICWVVLIYLACVCNNCMGDGRTVKAPDARQIERIELKAREKVFFKPKDENKEMLYGSVVWFVPKEEHGYAKTREDNEVKDVIRLRSRNINTYRRQHKSLDVIDTPTEHAKKDDENDEQNNPENKQASPTTRTSKSIEQNRKENGDLVHKEVDGKSDKNVETDLKTANTGRERSQNGRRNKSGAQKRRTNNGQNRRRNKNRAQKIKVNNENTTEKPKNNNNDAKKDHQENIAQNKSIAKNAENFKDEVKTKLEDLSNGRIVDNSANENSRQISSQEKEIIKEVKTKIVEIIEDKVVQQIKEVKNTEKSKASTLTEPPAKSNKSDETKPLTDSEKQKVVENADLLGLLLAQSDPSLVKVLIDNSSPENLNVFLSHSNITLDELKDIVAY